MNQPSAEQIRTWGAKISESDREAFDRLFRSMYPKLVRFVFGYTRNKAVACDLVQDVFITLWEKRRDVDASRSVKAYLYTIARNRSLNYLRDHSDETLGLEPSAELTALKTSPETVVPDEPSELASLMRAWIAELPERRREAFEMSRFEGLDHDEIAGVMNVSSSTVNNHIVAALGYLRDRYDDYLEKNKKMKSHD